MIMCNRLHLLFSPQILTPPGFQRRSNGVTVALGGLWLFLSQSWGHFHHSPWPKSRFFSWFYCYLLFFCGKSRRVKHFAPEWEVLTMPLTGMICWSWTSVVTNLPCQVAPEVLAGNYGKEQLGSFFFFLGWFWRFFWTLVRGSSLDFWWLQGCKHILEKDWTCSETWTCWLALMVYYIDQNFLRKICKPTSRIVALGFPITRFPKPWMTTGL